ncbi:proton-conducting transporter membrane subunit [Gaiella sp.]|uniref:proton-conducting transporter transmembrane domain-containing protein n=1 Tax=Gaiella sp. TaxID=2663207 RepID=UPI0032676A82
MTGLVIGGLLGIAIGGLLCLRAESLAAGFITQSVGALALGVAGLWALVSGEAWGALFTNELTPRAGIDGLTGVFLLTFALAACPSLVFASSYVAKTARGRLTGVLTATFLLSLIGVLCARDPLSFLFLWELMTLVPAAIILVGTATESARRTVFTYVAITHLGGAGTWIALLLLAHEGAIGNSTALSEGSTVQAVVAVAAIIGFGTKAGLMPMHAWLPRAHPIAPAPISALMSGVMVAVAVYGLVRVLVDWIGTPPSWIGATVLVLGVLSALGGITYALFQNDLKRLLAYSTVEHLGIVALGLGACLLFRQHGADAWAAFALGAALLHTVNHAVFKALLFLGAGTFERATGGLELDRLGGLLRRMPWSGGAFLVGCLAIAGMPLLNGFASEWLTLRALLQVPAYAGVWDGTLGAVALAALAGTMTVAVLCFVKVIGLVLLGPTRRSGVADAVESPPAMRGALVALAGACFVLGTTPGLLFPLLVGLAPWPVTGDEPSRPGLDLPGTGSLPTVGLLAVVGGLGALLWIARGDRRAAPSPSWAGGQRVESPLLWSSAGFSKPLRLVLEAVLRPQREIETTTVGGVVQEVSYEGRVPHLIDVHLYRPVTAGALVAASWARRLQSGRLGTYVGYLIALVVLLLVAVRVGAIG